MCNKMPLTDVMLQEIIFSLLVICILENKEWIDNETFFDVIQIILDKPTFWLNK